LPSRAVRHWLPEPTRSAAASGTSSTRQLRRPKPAWLLSWQILAGTDNGGSKPPMLDAGLWQLAWSPQVRVRTPQRIAPDPPRQPSCRLRTRSRHELRQLSARGRLPLGPPQVPILISWNACHCHSGAGSSHGPLPPRWIRFPLASFQFELGKAFASTVEACLYAPELLLQLGDAGLLHVKRLPSHSMRLFRAFVDFRLVTDAAPELSTRRIAPSPLSARRSIASHSARGPRGASSASSSRLPAPCPAGLLRTLHHGIVLGFRVGDSHRLRGR
jgi:hypothetical protein